MSPRSADPAVRAALIESAARLLAEREPLTLRRVAAEVGASTMAVYTHFGGMEELRREVRREGFARLATHMAAVRPTTDPVCDLAALGWAYCLNALTNPDLYRAMFLETTVDTVEAVSNVATFLPTVSAVERCTVAGRLSVPTPWDAAVQLWAFTHGLVALTLAGMLAVPELLRHLRGGLRASLIGYGDEPAAADRSLQRASEQMEPAHGWPNLEHRRMTLAAAASEQEGRRPRR